MNNLKIPLVSITEQGFHIETEADVKAIQPQDAESLPLECIGVQGVILPISGEFLFQGRVYGSFVSPCDRCLDEARHPFEVKVMWIFGEGAEPLLDYEDDDAQAELEEEAENESGERFQLEGVEIDLSSQVWEEAVLAAPVKYICRTDCKGLCPTCGVNRNHEPCSCRDEKDKDFGSNQGLAGLVDLFPDLAPKRTKE